MKLRESTTAKIAAIILSYIMALTVVITAAGTYIMGYYKFYFSNPETVIEEVLTDMAQREVHFAANTLYARGSNLESYYKDKNVFYEVIDPKTGEITDTNLGVVTDKDFESQKYLTTASTDYYNYEEERRMDEKGDYYWTTKEIHEATINIYIAENMTKNDLFSVTAKIIEIGFKLRFVAVFILLAAIILLITLLCYLFCAAGHRSGGEIKCNYLDMLPFDILTAIVVVLGILSVIVVDTMAWNMPSAVIWITLVGSLDYFIALGYTLSFATRVKTKTLIKNNLIYIIFRFFGGYFKKVASAVNFIYSNASLISKTLLITAGIVVLEVILCLLAVIDYHHIPEFLLMILIFVNILFIGAILYFAIILQKIKKGGERIAGGDLQYKIETDYMFGSFKEFSLSLNNINKGLQTAVEEKMRSERFKTELITNVSHDIKTPLTSIINYVDLIKKEKIENETVTEYLQVLERQSGRLKKLVEDLVEASKASTGNLTVNLAMCDVGVLLNQALGEFEDKLAKAQMSGKSVKIMADGRHLWRVFDNLLNNISKYSQSNTRVYIDLKEIQGKAVIIFRNISKYELNVSSDELMERFVRGDSSRNTEGSGLGLSIAKSLVELQGGELSLSVDGDLFKVSISFPIIKN